MRPDLCKEDKISRPGWPRRRCQISEEVTAERSATEVVGVRAPKVYRSPTLLQQSIILRVRRSLTEKPNGSNSTETELSIEKRRTEIRFLTMEGARRILRREKLDEGVCKVCCPIRTTGNMEPLPTVTDMEEETGCKECKIPSSEAICDVAPESITHSGFCMALRVAMSDEVSHCVPEVDEDI